MPYGHPINSPGVRWREALDLEFNPLIVRTSVGEVIEQKPIAFQWIDGKKIGVACEYILEDNRLLLCFPLGYDTCYELTIDPLLIFSTYSGSIADNWGSTATPAEHGNLYSAGVTSHISAGGIFLNPRCFSNKLRRAIRYWDPKVRFCG